MSAALFSACMGVDDFSKDIIREMFKAEGIEGEDVERATIKGRRAYRSLMGTFADEPSDRPDYLLAASFEEGDERHEAWLKKLFRLVPSSEAAYYLTEDGNPTPAVEVYRSHVERHLCENPAGVTWTGSLSPDMMRRIIVAMTVANHWRGEAAPVFLLS